MNFQSKNNEIVYDIVNIDGGYACYVSGKGTLTYSVECADTAEYMAIQNHSPFWCRPFWGSSLADLPELTQALLIKNGEDYTYYLPVCDSVFKTVIQGCEGGFEFRTYSNCDTVVDCQHQLAFLCLTGKAPLDVMKAGAKAACQLLDNGLKLREEKEIADVFNYLGWCSWDALQIRVNHDGLMEKVQEFKDKNVPIHFAVIDDMWADVPNLNEIPLDATFGEMVGAMHRSAMRSFAGDPKRFPKGMQAAIEDMKKAGIAKVGIWFPTTGYWAGLMPGESEAERQRDNTITLENGRIIVAPEAEKAARYFDDLCSRAKAWGGDFVKIDNQGFHQRYENIAAIGESSRAIQSGIDKAANKYFDGALINCMGMPSECMFNRVSTVSRCSDDFMPESREWFAKNVLQCAYNGLLQGQFYVNDWDMWWTDDDQAAKNSLCRAISGGPIYVSDKIGRTNPEILKPVCMENGRILRPDESATPTADCLIQKPTKTDRIFKIRNVMGENGLCAVFNINEENAPVSGTLAPNETGVANGDYVYYEYFTKSCGLLKQDEKLDIVLKNNDDFRLYTFVPYHGESEVCIGRTDLYMGIGCKEGEQVGYVVLDGKTSPYLTVKNP